MTQPLQFLEDEKAELVAQGAFRMARVLDEAQEPVCRVDGRTVINLSSNNYLALANHPRLRAAAIRAVEEFGAGSASVRTIAGTMAAHVELENYLADFKHTEAAVVFQSGFTSNAGTVGAILGKEDVIVSDALNHASIIDGCRLSRATIKVYRHADVADLRRVLDEVKGHYRRTLVVTDGVFSMDGDVAPLPDIVEAAEAHGAIIMVDDAHASGVLGKQGRGTVDHFGLHGRVHIQVGTLSKAIGVLGGYVAGPRVLIEMLHQRGRPFLFSTSHPPAVTAAVREAFRLLEEDDGLLTRLWDNTRFFKEGLRALGFDLGASTTPITPVIVGDTRLAMRLSDRLFEEGVFCVGIGFPTVPRGAERVRGIVTAGHTREELQRAIDAFARVGSELGILPAVTAS
ncbi:MAG: glycine C-acetyltransferase [Candidatus Sericytochromatia bacterium]|nr:glycine C-acetyltransferase [Candidatus Sericytochromatia bacterium]